MSNDLVKRLRSVLGYKDLGICPEAADRIEELEAKLAWQPIETAPKDGTEIIVGASLPWHGWRCDMVAWDKNRTMWWDNNGLPYQPTHWMSLPAPPSQN